MSAILSEWKNISNTAIHTINTRFVRQMVSIALQTIGVGQVQVEKRQYPRQIIDLHADFASASLKQCACKIMDFCPGGALLEASRAEGISALAVDDAISLLFSIDKRPFSVRARVVHVQKPINGYLTRIGLQFHTIAPATLSALQDVAERQRDDRQSRSAGFEVQSQGSGQPFDTHKARRLLFEVTNRFCLELRELMSVCMEKTAESLLATAESAASNKESGDLMDARALFQANARQCKESVISSVNEVVLSLTMSTRSTERKNPALPSFSEADVDALTLIDKGEFEDWLLTRVMANRAEEHYRLAIQALTMRVEHLGQLLRLNLQEQNPFAPRHLCLVYSDALNKLELKSDIAKVAYADFEQWVLQQLDPIYAVANGYLIEEGVLADLDPQRSLMQQGLKKHAQRTPKQDTRKSFDSGDRRFEVAEPKGSETPTISTTQPERTSTVVPASGAANTISFDPNQLFVRAAERIRGMEGLVELAEHSASNGSPKSGVLAVSDAELLQGWLSKINHQMTAGKVSELAFDQSLKDYLNKRYAQEATPVEAVVTHEQRVALEFIDQLFSSLMSSSTLDVEIKAQIKRLEVPLLQLLLSGAHFLTKEAHPARLVLNGIAQLAAVDGAASSQVLSVVTPVIDTIVEQCIAIEASPPSDIAQKISLLFDEALQALDQQLRRQQTLFDRQLDRVKESCSGKEKVELGKYIIDQEVNAVFEGVRVPKALIALLQDASWNELLLLSYLREGESSRSWQVGVEILAELKAHLTPDGTGDRRQYEVDVLFRIISKGLSKLSHAPEHYAETLKEVQRLLVMPAAKLKEIELVEFPLQVSTEFSPNPIDFDADGDIVDRWMRRVKRLKPGDWVKIDMPQKKGQMSRLAWVSHNGGRYVFVDPRGMKLTEYSSSDLSTALRDTRVQVVPEYEENFMDRGIDGLVSNIYSHLYHEATHDALTGLLNRKEMQRALHKVLTESRHTGSQHGFYYFDLEKFKVFNSAFGYEAGDALLKEVSRRVLSLVRENDIVSRLGANEFAVLFRDVPQNEAFRLANRVHEAVQEQRFEWDDQVYTVRLSSGFVHLDEHCVRANDVIKAGEYSALRAAEKGGREVFVFSDEDGDFVHREAVLNWVTQIDDALAHERLQLRCQRIEPLFQEASDEQDGRDYPNNHPKPHYELLLSIMDSEGRAIAPLDFVQAAERFNKILDVDRWVIDHALTWFSEHPDIFDHVAQFSINLSGASLNDQNILKYIFESFSKVDLPREKICFEVTETSAITSIEDAADFIAEVKNIGCQFSLDDFGSGLSSYTYLKSLPVDYIKIDGVFVKNICTDSTDYAMVRSMCEMGHFLGKSIIAEYAVDENVVRELQNIGVDYAQGFGVEKPMLLEELAQRFDLKR